MCNTAKFCTVRAKHFLGQRDSAIEVKNNKHILCIHTDMFTYMHV